MDWTRALFEAIDDAVFVHDADGNILDANPAACRRLGYTRDELLRLNTRDIDAPEFAAGFRERFRSQLATGNVRCEGVHRTKDGRNIAVDINTSAIHVDGKPAVLAVIRDISDRRRVENELRNSEALYHSLVEQLPQNVFRKDRQGRFLFANERHCETLNRPLADLLGKTDFDLYPHELAAKYARDDNHVMETGRIVDTVEQHHLPDGRTIFVHVIKSPVLDAGGAIVGVQGLFWDVTEQFVAERALADSERRYRQLTESTMDGILLLDAVGRIELFNPAAERMFGHAAADIVGEPVTRLFPAAFADLCAEGSAAYVGAHPELIGPPRELSGRRNDGTEIPVEIALSVVSGSSSGADGAPPGLLVAVRDMTERNKIRAMLVQNEKLASIGLLSAGVAHEINNPLAFVGNNMVVLERDCQALLDLATLYHDARDRLGDAATDVRVRAEALADEMDLAYVRDNLGRLIRRTRDGVDRVSRIVHSLRGLARTDAPRRQPTRLPELIDGSLEILHGRFKRLGVRVEQAHDPDPTVPCVSTQLSQVVLNLLVNAFQAIEACRNEGGTVRVRTERRGEWMVLAVADDGCGIRPEQMPKLFDPFFTTKDVGEGTGLGLSISHHIVAAHGGRIEVESTPGHGATFRVYLPLHDRKDRS
jgi:PAS domain S-box-containing protein